MPARTLAIVLLLAGAAGMCAGPAWATVDLTATGIRTGVHPATVRVASSDAGS